MQLINGGVFFMRPCPAAGAHMLQLLDSHPKLRFSYGTAEQDFFGWYYRYTGVAMGWGWTGLGKLSLVEQAEAALTPN